MVTKCPSQGGDEEVKLEINAYSVVDRSWRENRDFKLGVLGNEGSTEGRD